jgi:hypothetical protein
MRLLCATHQNTVFRFFIHARIVNSECDVFLNQNLNQKLKLELKLDTQSNNVLNHSQINEHKEMGMF